MKKALFSLHLAAFSVKRKRRKRQNESAGAQIGNALDDWISKKRYCEVSSVSNVARELGTTQRTLERWFRIEMGMNFETWRTTMRMEEARRILVHNSPKTLREVRDAVGIPDKSNFRRYFRRLYGCSPREWISEKKLHVRFE